MAIYRFDIRNSKTHNTSASDHDDYIKREGKYAPDFYSDYNQSHESKKYEDLIYKEDNNMPKFAINTPHKFWQSSEVFERLNGRTYTEFEVSLPHELSDNINIQIARDFGKEIFGNNFVYSLGIHKKSSSKKNIENIHVHYIFSERMLDGIEREPINFFKRYNPKNPENGGCKKDPKWHDINMPKIYRKKWEFFLNNELEKYNIEKVSCESLLNQKLEAERKGDFLKAQLLDREPININGYILMKIDKSGINSLTSWEKEEFEHFNEVKKFAELKNKIYKILLEQEPQVLDFSIIKNQELFNQNDSIERETTKLHCERIIERLEAKLLPQNLKRIILNAMTLEEYENKINTIKNLEKLNENKILTNEEKISLKIALIYVRNIEFNLKFDNEFFKKYIHIEEKIKDKYETIISKKFQDLREIEKLQIKRNYNEKELNILLKNNKNNINLLEKQKDIYFNAKKTLKMKEKYILKLAVNKASKGEYFKKINQRNILYSKYEILLENQKSLSIFNIIAKRKISKKIDNLSKQDKVLKKELLRYEQINIDKEREFIKNSFNNALNIIEKKIKDINTNEIFRKEKREILLINIDKVKKPIEFIGEKIKKIEIFSKISKEEILNICTQEVKLEYFSTKIKNLKDNLISENLKNKVLNILTKDEYAKNIELLNKQSLSPNEKIFLNRYINSFKSKELKDLINRKSNELKKLYSYNLLKYENLITESIKYEYNLSQFNKLDKSVKNKLYENIKIILSKKIGSCESELKDLNKRLEFTNSFIERLNLKEQIQTKKEEIQINKNTIWKSKVLLKEQYKKINCNKNYIEHKKYLHGLNEIDLKKKKDKIPNAWKRIISNENSNER